MRTLATFDWDFLEAEEKEWQEITDAAPPGALPHLQGWRRTLPGLGVVVLIAALAAVVGVRLWQRAETGIALIESDARTVVQLETLRANAKEPLCSDTATVESVEINASGLMVRVVVTETYGAFEPRPYVETRFYKRCASGWCRSAPLVSFWGRKSTLDTANLHFEFHERDRRAVEGAAESLDAYTSALRQLLDLPPLAPTEHITVTVVPTWVKPGAVAADGAILLPSPLLVHIPTNSDAASLLRDLSWSQVLSRTMDEAVDRANVREEWHVIVLYLRWWIEQNSSRLADIEAGESTGDNELYALCTPYTLSFLSADTFTAKVGNLMLPQNDPYTLSLLSVDIFTDYIPGFSEARPSVTNVFFGFVVSGKTQSSIPRLLSACGRHATWHTLAPEVLDMSFEELQRTLACASRVDRKDSPDIAP